MGLKQWGTTATIKNKRPRSPVSVHKQIVGSCLAAASVSPSVKISPELWTATPSPHQPATTFQCCHFPPDQSLFFCFFVSFFFPLWLTLLWTCAQALSHVQLFVTPWTRAHRAPLSMRYPKQEYWSGFEGGNRAGLRLKEAGLRTLGYTRGHPPNGLWTLCPVSIDMAYQWKTRPPG